MALTLSDEQQSKLVADIKAIEERVEKIRDRAERLHELRKAQEQYEPLSDENREEMRERLLALPDGELVCLFLTLHKIAEQRATGFVRHLLECESTMITVVLERLAPRALVDGLAVYFEWAEDDEGGEDG